MGIAARPVLMEPSEQYTAALSNGGVLDNRVARDGVLCSRFRSELMRAGEENDCAG